MTPPPTGLSSGTAVVTGAGSGLGRALAIELGNRGVTVVGFGRRKGALQDTQSLTKDGKFIPMVVDVADYDAVENAFSKIRKSLAPITILINNAGVYPRRDILDETAKSFMDTVAINLGGTVACTQQALLDMVETGIGRIINVSSFADMSPMPASSAYSVSKGAGRVFGRVLHADLADRFPEIVVSTWMPGMLATDMGIADGLAPEVAAVWGAELALWHDTTLNGTVFEMNIEVLPSTRLKQRIKNKLMFRKAAKPRRLGPS